MLKAQQYSYVQYTEKDGLPSDIVYDVCQDKNGFIWFATENGVCRYDGTYFKTFTTKDGLPDNAVLRIYCANDGTIWVTPFMYYPFYFSAGKFFPVNLSESDRKKVTNVVHFASVDSNMILNTATAQYFFSVKNEVRSIESEYTRFPKGGQILVFSSGIGALRNDSMFYKQGDEFKFTGTVNADSQIVNIHSNGKPLFSRLKKKESVFMKGYIGNNLFYVNIKDDLFFYSLQDASHKYTIHSKKPTFALVDSENTLWVATIGFGVFHYPSLDFTHTQFSKEYPELFSIEKFNNQVLAGDNFSNLHTINDHSASKDYSSLLAISGNLPAQASRQNRLYKLLSYKGSLYIGSDAFLLKKDSKGEEIIQNVFPIKDLSIEGDQLLVCMGTGVLLLNPGNLKVTDTLLRQRTTAGIIHNSNYYLGTIGGLIKMDGRTKKITSLATIDNAFAKRITAIKKTPAGSLWVSTSGAGVLEVENEKIVKRITTAEGLSSDICTSLYHDGHSLWVGTNTGLNKVVFEDSGISVTQFTTADGLSSNIVNAVFADSAMVYVAGPSGLNRFNKNFERDNSLCQFHFLNASIGDSVLQLDSVYHFSHNARNVRFDFIAISFKSAGDIKYYYQLHGLDDSWHMTTNTFINFSTLEPGSYTLKIKAVNKFGVESEVKSIKLFIAVPWWRTWWFISLLVLTIITGIYLIYRQRIRTVKRDEAKKRQVQAQFAALEQQALLAQMNPHFIFNCLNSIQSFVIRHDVEGANKYLAGFASLIRQTLDNSSEELISLSGEIKYLDTYLSLERTRLDNKFNYTVTVNTNKDLHAFKIPAMLLQPYVENAIRHGIQHRADEKGEISITFKNDIANNLCCTISDNGVGREKAGLLKSKQHIEYMSKGTIITAKRITMLNKQYNTNMQVEINDIMNKDGFVCGTEVALVIPDFSAIKSGL